MNCDAIVACYKTILYPDPAICICTPMWGSGVSKVNAIAEMVLLCTRMVDTIYNTNG